MPVVGESSTVASTRVRIAVLRGEREVFRDRDTSSVRAGRVMYREIAVET